MTPEQIKYKLAIGLRAQEGDIESVARIARRLLDLVAVLDQHKPPDNYTTEILETKKTYFPIAHGTKDYCIGFAEATRGEECRVVVSGTTFIVWSESQWGEEGP